MVIRPRRVFEWVEIIWRRKRVLFLMGLVMMVAAYVIIRRLPSIYESSTTIVVTHYPQGPDDPVGESAQFSALMAYLTSRGNLLNLLQRYKLYPEVKKQDLAIDVLNKAIKPVIKMRGFGYPDAPESVRITYRYPDPATAQKVMLDLVSNFEQANVGVRTRASEDLNTLKEKINEVETRLKELGPVQEIEAIRAQVAARQAMEDTANRAARQSVGTTIETLTDRQYTIERSIAELKRQIEEQEKIVNSTTSNGVPTANPAVAALLIRKAELEAKIKGYAQEYTERNPKMIEARQTLAQIEKEISRFESGVSSGSVVYSSPERTELKRMTMEMNRLQTDLDVTRRDLERKTRAMATLPAGSGIAAITPGTGSGAGGSSDTKSEHERLSEKYKALLGRQDQLQKLAGIAGSSTPMFQIQDPPFLPTVPVAPNRKLLMGIAMGFALGFGLVIILILELPRFFIFSDERDIQYFLGAPVLALIPETVSHSERSRHRRLRWTRNLVFLLFAAAIIPFLIVLIDRSGLFQILGNR
jgi:protein tyrosine kinase modulator